MSISIHDKIRKLPAAQQEKIATRTEELIAEEMSLRELRKARRMTQSRLAKALGITQDGVSRLEQRSDLLISTLRKTVRAMGGDVRIVAQFPNRPPVVVGQLSDRPVGRAGVRKPARSASTWGAQSKSTRSGRASRSASKS